jgi:NADH-quinone oxidoreductase subunit N
MGHYLELLPDLTLGFGATIILLLGPLRDTKNLRDVLRWFALIVLGAAGFLLWAVNHGAVEPVLADGWLTSAPINVWFGIVFLASIAWTILVTAVPEEDAGEWYSMLLFAGVGLLVLGRAANLAALFLGIEVLSISLYILIAFHYARRLSLRAGAMYLILAGFASGFLVFGLALVYANYGTLEIAAIQQQAAKGAMPLVALAGFALFLVGVGFKLAAVPFHMWTPDVYEAAPGPVTGLIASVSKGATLAALLSFAFLTRTHWQILWLMAALSMVGGNLLGLRELRVKRILAYSSIAHIGYVLVGFLGGSETVLGGRLGPAAAGPAAIFYYVVAYAIAIIGAFAALSMLDREQDLTLRDLRGVARRNPVVAFSLLIFVWSLAGLPPAAGFFGKIYLFAAGVSAGYYGLAVIGLIGSAIGIYYYVRIIVHLFMLPSDASDIKVRSSSLQDWALLAGAAATVAAGVFPNQLLALVTR